MLGWIAAFRRLLAVPATPASRRSLPLPKRADPVHVGDDILNQIGVHRTNTVSGDNNSDAISGVTMNFAQSAEERSQPRTAAACGRGYTITTGSFDTAAAQVAVAAPQSASGS